MHATADRRADEPRVALRDRDERGHVRLDRRELPVERMAPGPQRSQLRLAELVERQCRDRLQPTPGLGQVAGRTRGIDQHEMRPRAAAGLESAGKSRRRRCEFAPRAIPVPAQPRAAATQVRHLRVATAHVLRHLVDPALERGDRTGADQRLSDAQDQRQRLVPQLPAQEMMNRARWRLFGAGRALVQGVHLGGHASAELRFEEIAEQVVEAQHGPPFVDDAQEQVASVEFVERGRRVVVQRHGRAEHRRELGEDRAAQREVAQLRRQAVEHLVREIGEELALAGFTRRRERAPPHAGHRRRGAAGVQQHRQSDGPALRPAQRLEDPRAGTAVVNIARVDARELQRLVLAEAQVRQREFADLAMGTPARERQCRLHTGPDHDGHVLGQSLDQRFHQRRDVGTRHSMEVVEHDHDPRRDTGAERIDGRGQRRARLRSRARHACGEVARRRLPGQVQRFERLHERREQPVRVVVLLVDRDPDAGGARRADVAGQLRQQRGLARAAGGAHDGDGVHARRLVDPLDQRGARHRALAQARDPELGDGQDRQNRAHARAPEARTSRA